MKKVLVIIGLIFVAGASIPSYTVIHTNSERIKFDESQTYLDPVDKTEEDSAFIVCDELPILKEEDVPEYEKSRRRKVEEVVALWKLYFDDDNAPKTDPRRRHFYEWADMLVDAVELYTANPTDIGGQFPGGENDHLMYAYMIAKESSVTPDIKSRSKLGEVCFAQLHGRALAGYDPEKVRKNPRLCLILGARWLASRIPACEQTTDQLGVVRNWEDVDWVGPLSFYAGGPNAMKNGGGCKSFSNMRDRVKSMLLYRTRINKRLEFYE